MLRYLFTLNQQCQIAVAKLRSNFKDLSKGGNDVTGYITPLYWNSNCEFPKNGPIYLDNLQRLLLVNIDMSKHFTNKELYKEIETRRDIVNLTDAINSIPDRVAKFEQGIIRLTDFGKALCNACSIQDID